MTLRPGDSVRMVMTKWGDRPHWEFDATYLGSDEHGDWIGIVAGTHMSRPGAEYVAQVDQVGLVPADGAPDERGWLATFHAEGGPVRVYVDMTTPPVWDGAVLRAVDLDLDVVRMLDEHVLVDDEDEFEVHQVRYDYPAEVVALASATCARVQEALTERRAPFHGVADQWLARLRQPPPGG
jgi:predicted RNA-binding protein associated with RNAse of E/G family